jgi:transposase
MNESESVRGPGRPTKLTDEVRTAILEAVELGVPNDYAADLAGVHRSTFYRWKAENEDFQDALLKSKTRCIRTALERIHAASKDPKHWTAAAWLLERICPESFGRKVEVKTETSSVMTDADVEEARKRLDLY